MSEHCTNCAYFENRGTFNGGTNGFCKYDGPIASADTKKVCSHYVLTEEVIVSV